MLLLAGVFLLASATPAVPDPGMARLQVVVDLESGVDLDAEDLREIGAGVRGIWRSHVDVVVASRGDLQAGADDELTLVITNRLLHDSDSSGLGWIEFVNGLPRSRITISMAAVKGLMRAGAWRGKPFEQWPPIASRFFVRRAIMRAAAHEVGHYLLRTRVHATSGLMRPTFTIDEIMDRRPQLVRLAPAEVARLRNMTPQTARRPDVRATEPDL